MTSAGARGTAIGIAAALALLVFEVLPGSLYLGNLGEFWTAPAPIARLLLFPAALFIGIVAIGLRLARRTDFSRFSTLLAAVTLLAWIQAYLLVWDYGPLDGSPLDWDGQAWRGWLDLSLWAAGLSAAWIFHRQLEKPLITAALAVVALQAAVLVHAGFQSRDALALKATQRIAADDLSAMGRFSTGRNVVHIVLDSFQADVFNEIVRGPRGTEIQGALPGFTFFEEHLGTFPATYLAMPVILSGQVYRNHVPQRDFMEAVYTRGSVLGAARAAGFEVDVAADTWVLDWLAKGGADNSYLTTQVPLMEEASRLLDLALFRLSPHWLKALIHDDERWLTQRLFTRSALQRFAYFTHNAFLARVTRDFAADRPTPVYKFFHLMTTHAPFVANADCSPAGRVLQRIREHVTAQSRCSLRFVLALLDRMREAGIYDGSLIVIMGDHGGHVPPYRYRPGAIVEGNMAYELPPDYVALATPLLAIKPPGAAGPFRISSTFTSMTDVAATIDSLLELGTGLPGRSVLDAGRDPAAERRFYLYDWDRMDPVSEYLGTIQEHIVSGSAYEVESWRMGPVFSAPEER